MLEKYDVIDQVNQVNGKIVELAEHTESIHTLIVEMDETYVEKLNDFVKVINVQNNAILNLIKRLEEGITIKPAAIDQPAKKSKPTKKKPAKKRRSTKKKS